MFECVGEVEQAKIDRWLQSLLWEKCVPGYPDAAQADIVRFKALVSMRGSDRKHVVQAVQELFDIQTGAAWGAEKRMNKIVFIGTGLDAKILEDSFKTQCLV